MNISDRKPIVLLIGIILVITLWFIEKSEQIPQYSYVFYEMGLNCDDECGRNRQFQYFQKAVHHTAQLTNTYYDPRISDAHFRLALFYENRGDDEEAFILFIRATEFNNENSMALYKTGFHYFQRGDYKSALKYLRRSYILGNFPEAIHYYLARAYDETQDYELALVYYINILKLTDEYSTKIYPHITSIYNNHKDIVDTLTHRNRAMGNYEFIKQFEQSLEKALAFESPQ